MSKTSSIFNNPQPKKVVKKAYKSKKKFMKTYGDDSATKDIGYRAVNSTIDMIKEETLTINVYYKEGIKDKLLINDYEVGFELEVIKNE